MKWTIPNILTLLRLIAAPGVAVMFLYFNRPWADWFALALFLVASVTDFFDGYLARLWKQESKFGAMMDPIADKAMVVIAIAVLTALHSLQPWILLPATVILFREIFVSGLREFLGDTAGTLKVTNVAKWKTTAQMLAIAVLFSVGLFDHYWGMWTLGMNAALVEGILAGEVEDVFGLNYIYLGGFYSFWAGVALLWIAAALTFWSGADYYLKARPFLKEDR